MLLELRYPMSNVLSFLFLGGFHLQGRGVTGVSSSQNSVIHLEDKVEIVAELWISTHGIKLTHECI